jgi:hypothetical protein
LELPVFNFSTASQIARFFDNRRGFAVFKMGLLMCPFRALMEIYVFLIPRASFGLKASLCPEL